MVIRRHDYTNIKELDERLEVLSGHQNSISELEEAEDLNMYRGELELEMPATHPRHRA